MTALGILTAARAKISTPEKWCKGVYAIDVDGNNVSTTDYCAHARCSSGALYSVRFNYKSIHEAWDILAKVAGRDFAKWQDEPSRTHAEVLAAWDVAIARTRNAEGVV